MAQEIIWTDPRLLRLPQTRLQGADPARYQRQVSTFGKSIKGMPPLEAYRTRDGEIVIWNGATRAVRAAKLAPGELVPVEIIGDSKIWGQRLPRVEERLP